MFVVVPSICMIVHSAGRLDRAAGGLWFEFRTGSQESFSRIDRPLRYVVQLADIQTR